MSRTCAMIAAAGLAGSALAQPSNDECENAIVMSPCGSYNGSNVGATGAGNIGCTPSAWYDVWYSVAVPGRGLLRVYTCPSPLDTVLVVYSACPGSGGGVVACNNDDPYCGPAYPGASHVTVDVLSPQTYLIRISGANLSRGSFTLNTEFSPSNDYWYSATSIGNGSIAGTTVCATVDGSASCGFSAPDVWYRYTPSCSGMLTAYTCPAGFDTVISVHTGGPGTIANQVACNDDSLYCGTAYPWASAVVVPVIGRQPYFIRVAGHAGATGTFYLNTQLAVDTPPNDACANAIAVGDGDTPFATCGATSQGPLAATLCGFPEILSDIWYRYTAPCNGRASVSLCDSNFDTRLAVYNANCPTVSGQEIACDDNSCQNRSFVLFPTVAGREYLIRIGGGSAQGSGIMQIACTPDACYANCDGSTLSPILNVSDFTCFLNRFTSGDTYANCDHSTLAPVLNISDFTCFLNAFGAGCS